MQKKPDPSVFYSFAFINKLRELAVKDAEWGQFISPDSKFSQTPESMGPLSDMPFKAVNFDPFLHADPLFSSVVNRVYAGQHHPANYHRSSAKYYLDCFNLLRQHKGSIHRLVEIGPMFGDLSCFFAGALEDMNLTLDLVDINKFNLLSTYERIQRLFPEVISRVRLFFGDLPIYIKNVSCLSPKMNLLHYQASSNFNDVVRDLGATYYSKHNIFATIVHNTHLRSTDMNQYAFTDAALYSLFGANMTFIKMGEEHNQAIPVDASQNPVNYYAPYRVDGMYIPYANNTFRYPSLHIPFEAFLYKADEAPVIA